MFLWTATKKRALRQTLRQNGMPQLSATLLGLIGAGFWDPDLWLFFFVAPVPPGGGKPGGQHPGLPEIPVIWFQDVFFLLSIFFK